MNKPYTNYHDYLMKELRNKEEALAYLNAAAEDEDERVFLLALTHVFEACVGTLSKKKAPKSKSIL